MDIMPHVSAAAYAPTVSHPSFYRFILVEATPTFKQNSLGGPVSVVCLRGVGIPSTHQRYRDKVTKFTAVQIRRPQNPRVGTIGSEDPRRIPDDRLSIVSALRHVKAVPHVVSSAVTC